MVSRVGIAAQASAPGWVGQEARATNNDAPASSAQERQARGIFRGYRRSVPTPLTEPPPNVPGEPVLDGPF